MQHSGPAVHDDWSAVRGVALLHPPQEHEERCRGVWHTVVRPRCELELSDLPPLSPTDLNPTDTYFISNFSLTALRFQNF